MQTKFGLASFMAIVAVIFIAVVLFIPLNYYQPEADTWVTGPSFINRIVQGSTHGIPIEQVAWEWVRGSVTNPLENSCSVSTDCVISKVENQCKVYCGSEAPENEVSLHQLSLQRTCDPATWSVPKTKCGCIFSKCILFTQK